MKFLYLVLFILAQACHVLNNDHDKLALQCGIGAKTTDDLILRFTAPGGLSLTTEQLARLTIQIHSEGRFESQQPSLKGCISVRPGTDRISARISGESPLTADVVISKSKEFDKILSVELEAPGYLELGLKCPKNGLLASDTIENVVEVKKLLGKPSNYEVRLRITTAADEQLFELFSKETRNPVLKMPATFQLNQLAEGSYKVELEVIDHFNTVVSTTSRSQCGLLVRRTCAPDESFNPDSIACTPKLCDNTYRIGTTWTESLSLQRGVGQYECKLVDGSAKKIRLGYSCKGGFVKADGTCSAAKSINGTCALLENDSVACWGTILRLDRFHLDPDAHDLNIQTVFQFPEKVLNFGHSCVGTESGAAYCWGQHFETGYYLRTDSYAPKTWDSIFPKGFISFDGFCGINLQGEFWCKAPTETTFSSHIRLPNKIVDGSYSCIVDTEGQLFCRKSLQPLSLQLDESISYDGYFRVPSFPGAISSFKKAFSTDCFLLKSGNVLCSGDNTEGAVGSNSPEQLVTKLSYVVDSNDQKLSDIIQIDSFGGNVAGFCAVQKGGRVYCWGSNTSGQLANGTPGQDQEGFNLFSRFAVPIIVDVTKIK